MPSLPVRMTFYCLFFLGMVLGVLPWLAYRLDVYLPALHVEIGWFRLVGGAILLFFLGTYLYCSYQLTSLGHGAYVEFDPPTEFVAEGPYRWCRNPVAACVVVMVFGEAIALSSTGVFLLFLIGLPLAQIQVVLLEEPLLRKRFGARYEEYLARVPRWIPSWSRVSGQWSVVSGEISGALVSGHQGEHLATDQRTTDPTTDHGQRTTDKTP